MHMTLVFCSFAFSPWSSASSAPVSTWPWHCAQPAVHIEQTPAPLMFLWDTAVQNLFND